ncbi:type IX secretion system outer membrane channel protein PorV [Ochrovirga pacifica]|uniref:type IX secretion system outer membrane channel protein PorV n=1 Tax=Ochrovirga pacifica TaxID=1042376 RepID=UPI000255A037|nr:type IX secretion system outer membrane channel protein PorV [Ochrovirga pacifica]
MRFKVKSFLLLTFLGVQLHAQENNSITTVAPFLNIVTDARAAAMGDVGVATSADGNSIFHNASKMVFHKSEGSLALNYTPWLRQLTDDIYIANLTYQQRIDERSAFGGGIKYFDYGTIEVTQEGSESTSDAQPYEFAIDAAYALKLSENYSMSVALRYTRADLSITGTNITDIEPTNGFAVDISGYYQSNEMAFDQFNGVVRGGFSISNLGPKVEVVSREEFLPTNLKLGGGFDFIFDDYNQIGLTLEFTKLLVPSVGGEDENFISGALKSFGDAEEGFSEELQEVTLGFGAEYLYNNAFAFRAGYFKENENKGNRNFLTFGAGFKASAFKVDLSYLLSNASVNNPLDRTLRISFTFDFGDSYEF